MHYWGDEWFEKNGNDLNCAIDFIYKFIRKWGRLKYSNKEKYGTMQEEFTRFYDGGIHYFICKNFVGICHPFIYWKIDPIIRFITKYTGLRYLIIKYQIFVYNSAHQIACKKYPNVTDELIVDTYYSEFIKPNIFGKIKGKDIYNKYWNVKN